MSSKLDWTRVHPINYMDFSTQDKRTRKRWHVIRESDKALIAFDASEEEAKRIADYMTKTAPDGETFKAKKRRK